MLETDPLTLESTAASTERTIARWLEWQLNMDMHQAEIKKTKVTGKELLTV